MIETKTVFVLGAGANAPYGYPTGAGLRKEICKKSVGDPTHSNVIFKGLDDSVRLYWQKGGI